MISLKDKVVVITGASSGIGRATAIQFAQAGAKLVLAARRIERLKELTKNIHRYNKSCIYLITDISNEGEVINLFNETEKEFGTIHILINNAGRGLKSELDNISYNNWLSVINTNLTGVFLCTKEAVKRMKGNNKGHIITVSSIAGLYGAPSYSAYCASKHGVTGFMRALRFEVRKYGIKVTTLHPARINTEFFNSYKKRPHKLQMISAADIARYITAIASGSFPKIVYRRIVIIFKRINNLIKYPFRWR